MCSNRFKKSIINSLVALAAVFAIGGLSLYTTHSVAAEGGFATNPGYVASGGQCGFKISPVPAYAWHDFCIGATWMYFSFDESHPGISVDTSTYTATIADAGHMPGGEIGPCSWEEDAPMTEQDKSEYAQANPGATVPSTKKVVKHTSGFFRLGLVSYNPATYLKTKSILSSLQPNSKTGPIAGLLSDSSLQEFSGPSGVPYLQIPGSMSFDDAHTRYNEAIASGKLLSASLVSWGGGLGGFCYDTSWSGGSALEITDADIVPDTDKPQDTTNANGGHFYSRSTVSIPDQNTDVNYISETSNNDGTVTVRLSTDGANFTGNFHHVIYWQNDQRNGYYGAPATTWSVTRTVSRNSGNNNSSKLTEGNTYQVAQDRGGSEDNSGNLYEQTYSTNLNPGDTVKVCYTIHYDPKYISYTAQSGSSMHTQTGFSGDGSSTACYEITRPKEPTTTPSSSSTVPHPQSDGSRSENNGSIMYAGETSQIGWSNIWAEGYPARRFAQYQEITYLVRDDIAYYNGITVGNNYSDYSNARRNSDDPCAYYRRRSYGSSVVVWPSTTSCAIIDMHTRGTSGSAMNNGSTYSSISWNTSDSYFTNSRTVDFSLDRHQVNNIVPDYVGYKYCNAAGWKFEYWIGVDKDGDVKWAHQGSKDYWVTANASCRTIAKRPSLTTWNGSLYTLTQSIRTSLADRHVGNSLYSLGAGQNNAYSSEYGLDEYTYGSWSEYLTVAGGLVQGYGSGASIARGANLPNTIYPEGTTLTIANNGSAEQLGYSSISMNQSLYTRLDTYLRNRATTIDHSISNSELVGANGDVTEQKIYNIKGDLTIDNDIVVRTSGYGNIYTIPRVILFVDGNVKVSGNVSQIDAWIIASGNIDTCQEYNDATGKNSSNTNYSNGAFGTSSDTYNLEGSACAKQLAFNGPVMASSIALHRSYGSDIYVYRNGAYAFDTLGNVTSPRNTNYYRTAGNTNGIVKSERYTPAEIFNYRADDYLWAYAQAGRYSSSYTESYSRELAPRY